MVVVPFLYVLCRANAEILFYCFAMELIFIAYYVEKVPLVETVVRDKIRRNVSDLYASRVLRGLAFFCFGFLCFSGALWASNNNIRYSFVAFALFFASCCLIVVEISSKTFSNHFFVRLVESNPYASLILLALFCGGYIVVFGNRQFAGYDYSLLVELGWRQFIGQLPYVDFLCTVPIGFVLGSKYALTIFGPAWNSFILLNAFYAFFSAIIIFQLLRELNISVSLSLIITMACEAMTLLLVSVWWHSAITSIAAVMYFLSVVKISRTIGRVSCGEWGRWIFLFGLLLMMKPNVVFPLLILSVLFLMVKLSSPNRIGLTVSLMMGLGIAAAYLSFHNISAPVVLSSYFEVSGRAFPDKFFPPELRIGDAFMVWAMYVLFYLAILMAFAIIFNRSSSIKLESEDVLLFIAVLSAGAGVATNWELKWVDFPLAIVAIALWLNSQSFSNRFAVRKYALRMVAAICVASSIATMFMGCFGYRSLFATELAYFEWSANEKTNNLFFHSLITGNKFQTVLSETAQVLETQKPSRVFFGPRIEFLYAANAIHSPTRLPLWWHPGSSYGFSREQEIIAEWNNKSFDLLIFRKNDYTRMPNAILKRIKSDYIQDNSLSEITVYYPGKTVNK